MEPIFPKWTNKIPKYLGIGLPVFFVGLVSFIWYYGSPKFLNAGYQPVQPVPFSHQLHAGKLGMDCRYCHVNVEEDSYASIPPTETCMGCHNKVLPNSPRLAPVMESFKNNTPIPWVRIHSLPRHVHFDHSAHLNAGVSCKECHGRIDKMETVRQVEPLSMSWCLDCHRNPQGALGPKEQITNLAYPENAGFYITEEWKAPSSPVKVFEPPTTDCGACHY